MMAALPLPCINGDVAFAYTDCLPALLPAGVAIRIQETH
jgi:hypothetical protein